MIPLVSVIVPTYNVAPYITQCIESLLQQTLREIEIIAVDDASTDNTWEMLEHIARADQRLIIKRHKKNTGHPSSARNESIERARGKYIAFVDADDWVASDILSKHAQAMAHCDCDMGYCGTQIWDDSAHKVEETLLSTHTACTSYFNWRNATQHFWTSFSSSACFKMYRRDFLQKNHIRYPIAQVEDFPFVFMCTVLARRIVYLREALYYIRVQRRYGTSRDNARHEMMALDCVAHWETLLTWIEKNHIPAQEELLAMAYKMYKHAMENYVRISECERYQKKSRAFFAKLMAISNVRAKYLTPAQKQTLQALVDGVFFNKQK